MFGSEGRENKRLEIISFENVSKAFEPGNPVLCDFSVSIRRGEFVFITGASGAGKSTLIRLLLREVVPDTGRVTVMGNDLAMLGPGEISTYRRCLGVVFQDFRLLADRNVYDNVAFAQTILEIPAKEIRRNVPMVLATVGLADKYKNSIDELSGGEKQRVAIARALVNRPEILLADEPTGNLDPDTGRDIMRLLEKINETGTTVIVVTHDADSVNLMKKRVITLKNGSLLADEQVGSYLGQTE